MSALMTLLTFQLLQFSKFSLLYVRAKIAIYCNKVDGLVFLGGFFAKFLICGDKATSCLKYIVCCFFGGSFGEVAAFN